MARDSRSDYPVIRFVTLKHESITRTYKVSYPKFILKAGQKAEIFYNPEKPSDFILNLKIDKWLLLILLISAMACFAWAGVSLINNYNNK